MFLTCGGCAGQQLRQLGNALAHDACPAQVKERHIMGSCENAMHLVRLYLMCLEEEETVTCRAADHDLLMDIRNGRHQKADHTFSAEFYDLLNDLEQRPDYAKENTSLPEMPDLAQIEVFQMEINERVVRDEF